MIESLSKFNQILKKIGGILIFIMPVLSIAYFLWLRFRVPFVFYVANYSKLSYFGALVLLAGYVFTISLLIYTKGLHKSRIKKLGIILFAMTVPLCCLSSTIVPSLPIVLDKAEISNTTYYLTGELEVLDSHAFHRLYKCNEMRFLCERTPFFAGGGASFRPLHLMIDSTTVPNEINVTWTSYDGEATFLEYTYGAQPRYYDYPAQLGNHLYYLAHYRYSEFRPKSTTFVLYECKLDNTSCKQLPIKYVGFGYLRDTIADETTGEISVFIDNQTNQDTLIFTWGENPRCHVGGCEILEELR